MSFSFSAQEIRQFVCPKPSGELEVDTKKARYIWEGHGETFARRLKTVQRIARVAATDKHWYQELPQDQTAEALYKHAKFLACKYFGESSVLKELTAENGRLAEEPMAHWRKKVRLKPDRNPSIKDIEYVQNVTSAMYWKAVAEDWYCIACKRPKRETIRKSKNNGWVFLLRKPQFSASGYKGQHEFICSECGDLASNLGREASRIAGIPSDQNYARYVQLSELEQVVRPQAYGRHNVDCELADRLVERLVDRVRAPWHSTTQLSLFNSPANAGD